MHYVDAVVFPKCRAYVTALTNVAQTLLPATAGSPAANTRYKVTHFVIGGGVAARVVIFRAVGAGTEYMRIAVPANDTVIIPGFDVPVGGLEILTSAAALDVYVTAFYVSLGTV